MDDIFLALSHPTRRAMLQRLAEAEATVNELVALFDVTQPSISSHLKLLERAGLVTRHRDAQFRLVRLSRGALARASSWLAQFNG